MLFRSRMYRSVFQDVARVCQSERLAGLIESCVSSQIPLVSGKTVSAIWLGSCEPHHATLNTLVCIQWVPWYLPPALHTFLWQDYALLTHVGRPGVALWALIDFHNFWNFWNYWYSYTVKTSDFVGIGSWQIAGSYPWECLLDVLGMFVQFWSVLLHKKHWPVAIGCAPTTAYFLQQTVCRIWQAEQERGASSSQTKACSILCYPSMEWGRF